ncbi:MAG: hypothetical protein QXK74_06165 [Candidatus Nitrosocaldaceae archaeon]
MVLNIYKEQLEEFRIDISKIRQFRYIYKEGKYGQKYRIGV